MPVALSNDTFRWRLTTYGSWGLASNWTDVTSGTDPAISVPGATDPVVFLGATGFTVSDGGVSASLLITGTLQLSGGYITGPLSIGTQTDAYTYPSGTLSLGGGSSMAASSVNVVSGSITLSDPGTQLSSTGTITLGEAQGNNQFTGSGYAWQNGATGNMALGGGATLVAGSDLAIVYGSVALTGASTRGAVAGNVTVGMVGHSIPSGPDYSNGSAGTLSVGGGAHLAVAGNLTEGNAIYYYGQSFVGVDGVGSQLTVGGTASIAVSSGYAANSVFVASNGGAMQVDGLVLSGVSATVDSTSRIEVGEAGGSGIAVAAGALTVDAGKTVRADASSTLSAVSIVNNGTIVVTAGTLTVGGELSGSGQVEARAGTAIVFNSRIDGGTVLADGGDHLTVSGAVLAPGTIALSGIGDILELGQPGAVVGTISGLQAGDTLLLDGVTVTGSTYTPAGGNTGTLALWNNTTLVATLNLVGNYSGKNFLVTAPLSGVNSVVVQQDVAASQIANTGSDAFTWVGNSGGIWGEAVNWDDTTTATTPAAGYAGANNAVTIAGPSSFAYERITGGGSAGSLSLTGDVQLSGAYNAGTLTVGSQTDGYTYRAGSMPLLGGASMAAGRLNIIDGGISLADPGTALTVAGTVSIGEAQGNNLYTGSGYTYQNGATGSITATDNTTLTVGSDLSIVYGSVSLTGASVRDTVGGNVMVGMVGHSTPGGPDYSNGSAGTLSVAGGAQLAVAGSLTEGNQIYYYGRSFVGVDGTGSQLTVAGTANITAGNGYAANSTFVASNGGAMQVDALVLSGVAAAVDSASRLEVGEAGGSSINVALGALTVDAGKLVRADGSSTLATADVINNGSILATAGTLTVSGNLDGTGQTELRSGVGLTVGGTIDSGTFLADGGNHVTLNGAVQSLATLALGGTGDVLELGTPGTMAGMITGFDYGDSMMLDGVTVTGVTYTATGANVGSLALRNGASLIATLNLTGNFAGRHFLVTNPVNGVNSIVVEQSAPVVGSETANATTDALTWIGSSGGYWGREANWQDTTTNAIPATGFASAGNAVTIVGGSSGGARITGGGSAASLMLTGNVQLSGAYNAGTLTVGSQTDGYTYTAGSMPLLGGASMAAGKVNIIDGGISLADPGTALTVSGAISIGEAQGSNLYTGSGYAYQNGATGSITATDNTTLTVGSDLSIVYGSVSLTGASVRDTVGGNVMVGMVGHSTPGGPDYSNGSAGTLSVAGGAQLAVAGSLTEGNQIYYYGRSFVGVDGTGSQLTVAGTANITAGNGYAANSTFVASNGGAMQVDALVLSGVAAAVDSASRLEVGEAGGSSINVALGALTVDAGKLVRADGSSTLATADVINNGSILATAGTLTVSGNLDGTGQTELRSGVGLTVGGTIDSGTLEADGGNHLTLNGGVKAAAAIMLAATGDILELGQPGAVAGTISGLQAGDTLLLDGVTVTGSTYTPAGGNTGTLALWNNTTLVATLNLVGNYSGKNFLVTTPLSGVNSVVVQQDVAASQIANTGSDAFTWVGNSGGIWGEAVNWDDTTTATTPAAGYAGANNAVTIAGPSSFAYERITGGGSAGSLSLTGDVQLSGAYNAGTLTVGSQTDGYTYTVGSMPLLGGASMAAGRINIIDGGISLADPGTALTTTGTLSIGEAQGSNLYTGSGYAYQNGATGSITATDNTTLTVGSDLSIVYGSVSLTGASVRDTVGGNVMVGMVGHSTPGGPDYSNGSAGTLSVAGGAQLAVAGSLTEGNQIYYYGRSFVGVDGTGSQLTVAGTANITAGNGYAANSTFVASNGGAMQVDTLVLSGVAATVDSASRLEVGEAGGSSINVAVGALTVDAGKLVRADGSSTLSMTNIVDNGTILANAGTLTVAGELSGSGTSEAGNGAVIALSSRVDSGTLQADANGRVLVNSSVASAATVALGGSNAVLEIAQPSAMAGTISGLSSVDQIVLDGVNISDVNYVYSGNNLGVLTVHDHTGTVATLKLAGDYVGRGFVLNGGTITVTPAAANLVQAGFSGITPAVAGVGSNTSTSHFITLHGTGTVGGSIALTRGDGTPMGSAPIDANGNWAFDYTGTSLPDGTWTIIGVETAGSQVFAPIATNVTIETALPPVPVITGISPDTGIANDGITSARQLTLSGTGATGDKITVSRGSTVLGNVIVGNNGTWTYDDTAETLSNGSYNFTATATDAVGNVSGASPAYQVTVDGHTPAAPSIAAVTSDSGIPSSAGMVYGSAATFTGMGEAGDTVALTIDNTLVGSTTVAANGTWSFDDTLGVNLGDGSHMAIATQTDPAGTGSASSGYFQFTVDRSLRTDTAGTLTAPVDITDESQPAVSVGAPQSAMVQLSDNGTLISTAYANASGVATLDGSSLGIGPHNLTAEVTLGGTVTWEDPAQLIVVPTSQTQFVLGPSSTNLTLHNNAYYEVHFGDVGTMGLYLAETNSDKVLGGNANATIDLGTGNSFVLAGSGNDTVSAQNGNNNIYLGNGNNSISAGNGTNNVIVGNGANQIVLGNGIDEVEAGNGSNAIQLGNSGGGTGRYYAQAGNGNNVVSTFAGSNGVQLGDGNNTVYTESANDTIMLGNGNNNVILGTGMNFLRVGSGQNYITETGGGKQEIDLHGGGNNTVHLADSNDLIYGGGSNTIQFGNGNVQIALTDGANTITGGDGADVVTLYSTTMASQVTLGNGNNTVVTAGGGATITLGSGNNYVEALGGNNTITVGAGSNVVKGDSGNDVFNVTAGYVHGNGPTDVFNLGAGGGAAYGGWGANSINISSGAWYVAAAAGSDRIEMTGVGGFAYVQMFDITKDMLVLSNAAFGLGVSGLTGNATQAVGALLSGNTDGTFTGNSLLAYNASTGVLYDRANTASGGVAVATFVNDPTNVASRLFVGA